MIYYYLLYLRDASYREPPRKIKPVEEKVKYTFRNTIIDKQMYPEMKNWGEFVGSYGYGLVTASKATLFWKKILPTFLFNWWFAPYVDMFIMRDYRGEVMAYGTNNNGHMSVLDAEDMEFFKNDTERGSPMWVLYNVKGDRYKKSKPIKEEFTQ